MKEIDSFLNNLYTKLNQTEKGYQKAEILFAIIQIKSENRDFENVCNSIYVDSKNFISIYINSVDSRSFGYDFIELNKIIKIIEFNINTVEKIALCNYSCRLLLTRGFEDENSTLKNKLNSYKTTSILEQGFKLKTIRKLTSHLTSYSIKALMFTIFILFIITLLIFSPAPIEQMELFIIEYEDYSSDYLVNHILNFLAESVDVNEKFTIKPINELGILILVILKIVYILIILNYIYRKTIDLLSYAK